MGLFEEVSSTQSLWNLIFKPEEKAEKKTVQPLDPKQEQIENEKAINVEELEIDKGLQEPKSAQAGDAIQTQAEKPVKYTRDQIAKILAKRIAEYERLRNLTKQKTASLKQYLGKSKPAQTPEQKAKEKNINL